MSVVYKITIVDTFGSAFEKVYTILVLCIYTNINHQVHEVCIYIHPDCGIYVTHTSGFVSRCMCCRKYYHLLRKSSKAQCDESSIERQALLFFCLCFIHHQLRTVKPKVKPSITVASSLFYIRQLPLDNPIVECLSACCCYISFTCHAAT